MSQIIPQELLIDVSEFDPPKPFQDVVQLVLNMKKGQYIRMLHRKKPYPLLEMLQKEGYMCVVKAGKNSQWEVIIWNKNDSFVNDYFR